MSSLSTTATISALGFRRSPLRTRTPAASSLLSPLSTALRVPRGFGNISCHFRLLKTVSLHTKCRFPVVCASATNPSNAESRGKDNAGKSSSDVPDGPPLLTILAGVIVFLLACWVVGSIIMWLIGLIVNVPRS